MSSNDYPRMMYRHPGAEEIHGGHFATVIVQDEDEQDAAATHGWHLTTTEALDAGKTVPVPVATGVEVSVDTMSRDQLKAKCAELGILYARTATDQKLVELIAHKQAG